MRRFLALALVLAAAPAVAGCRSKPGLSVGAGWSSTPELTGPTASIGLGEWEADPFGNPDGEEAPTPAPVDPALTASLKDLESKQAAAQARLADLDAKVASGALSAEQAQSIRDGTEKAEKAAKDAQKASADARELHKRLDDAEKNSAMPGWIPKDLTVPGLIAFAAAWGTYLLRKRTVAGLRAQVAEALAKARRMTEEAVVAFDNVPDSGDEAAVRSAVKARTEDLAKPAV